MPTPYQIALLLTRLAAAMNLVVGIFSIVGAIVVAALITGGATTLDGVAFTLLSYGIYGLIGGIGVLLLGPKIATFASKF